MGAIRPMHVKAVEALAQELVLRFAMEDYNEMPVSSPIQNQVGSFIRG